MLPVSWFEVGVFKGIGNGPLTGYYYLTVAKMSFYFFIKSRCSYKAFVAVFL